MSRRTTVWVLFFALTACKPQQAAPDAASEVAGKAAEPIRQRMLGSWTIRLDGKQKREQRVLMLAVREQEPTDQEMADLGLDDREKSMVLAMRQHRAANPNDPQLEQMRKVVNDVGGSSMRISTSTLTMVIGGVRQDAAYKVSEESAEKLVLKALAKSGREETMTIRMPEPGTLTLAKSGTEGEVLTFVRSSTAAP